MDLPTGARFKQSAGKQRRTKGHLMRSEGLTDYVTVVTEVWGECLGITEVRPDDDFFLLGGHSLLVLEVIDRLAERTGVVLAVRAFFEYPTPCGIARLLETG